jgi:hypothetical protein
LKRTSAFQVPRSSQQLARPDVVREQVQFGLRGELEKEKRVATNTLQPVLGHGAGSPLHQSLTWAVSKVGSIRCSIFILGLTTGSLARHGNTL